VLRQRMVEEWSSNCDFYQGFLTHDVSEVPQQFLTNGHFTGEAENLMVLTLSNVLLMPITVFTSIPNMETLCILPTIGVSVITAHFPGVYTHRAWSL